MLNYSIFQIISYQQCQMGLITVHLFSNHTHNKQALETCTEKQSTLNIREQPHNYQQFALIVQNTTLSQTQRIVPYFTYRRSPLNKRVAPQPSLRIHSWSQLFNNGQLLPKILSFVNGEDLLMLKYCNRLLRREALISILQKQNNWDLTFGLLAPYLLQQTHLRESGAEQDYQHSQDLDRTSGYFQYQNSQDLQQHQLKLDRIITTVSFKIQYFQGIMPICANLLQCFNQHISYWLLRFLLHKCRYIQNDIQFYNKYICILEDQFQNLLPQVYRHLNHMGFQLNYFVMKWIMGLFSEDMSKTMALALWDLICQTDVFILIYAIVEIFRILSADILCSGEDEINTMIKINLKERLGNVKSEQLMKCIKQLYITRRLYKASIK